MKFSELFNVQPDAQYDWFDPILTQDTRLFIDPLLIEKQPFPHFENARDKLVAFYDAAFSEAARISPDTIYPRYRLLLQMLTFPEVRELCLGYASDSIEGSGSGHGVAPLFAEGIYESIEAGIEHIAHFEEVALLKMGIGADRISDMAANILRPELAAYTNEICERYEIPTSEFWLEHGEFNFETMRWEPLRAKLPENPYAPTRRGILLRRGVFLVPRPYLRKLPEISPGNFRDYIWVTENQTLRDEFGLYVKRQLSKEAIVAVATKHREFIRKFVEWIAARKPEPYDLLHDPNRLYRWYDAAQSYVGANPLRLLPANDPQECLAVVAQIVGQFKHCVEQRGGWNLLWNDNGRHKNEKAAQSLFYAIAISYCRANGIDVTPEAETGRGPVDFKFSSGFEHRVLLEVKLASNSQLEHGIMVQTPTYMKAEQTRDGTILVVAHTAEELADASKRVPTLVKRMAGQNGFNVESVIVSAIKPKPASKA